MQNGVFISSIPKSGTHLLSSLIESWSGQPVISVKEKANYKTIDFSKYSKYKNLVGHYRVSHVKSNASLRELLSNRTVIVVIRDPRDLCNSMLHYVLKSTNTTHQAAAMHLKGLNFEQQIIRLANGISLDSGVAITPSLNSWCSGFIELLNEFKNANILRYEDFFEINSMSHSIAQILAISIRDARVLVENSLSSGSKTKREGGARPTQWKLVYSDELKKYFSDNHSEIIKYLGYEV